MRPRKLVLQLGRLRERLWRLNVWPSGLSRKRKQVEKRKELNMAEGAADLCILIAPRAEHMT